MEKLYENICIKMNKVLVAVSDSNYIKYFLPLIESAKDKGKWDGDFCLIISDETDNDLTKSIEDMGIHIFRPPKLPENPPPHFYKMYLFDEYFKKWDWILFSDLDVIFLNTIELDLDNKDKKYLYTKKDGLSFMNHFYGATDGFLEDKPIKLSKEQKDEKDKIYKKYGDGDAFQTCFLLYHSDIIKQGYFKKLKDAYLYYYCYYELARNSWWDQSIFNIVFYEKWLDIGEKFINRNPVLIDIDWELETLKEGYMDTNDYTDIIALHFFNFFPPWNENNLRFYPIWKDYHEKF